MGEGWFEMSGGGRIRRVIEDEVRQESWSMVREGGEGEGEG